KTHTALTTRAHRLACSLFSLGSAWFLLLVLVLHVHCVPGVPGSVPVREAAQEVLGWTIAVVPQPSGAYQHLGSEDSEGKHDKQGWRYLTGEAESASRAQDDPAQRLPPVIRQRHTSDRRQGLSHPRTPRCVHDADQCRNIGGREEGGCYHAHGCRPGIRIAAQRRKEYPSGKAHCEAHPLNLLKQCGPCAKLLEKLVSSGDHT